MPKNIVTETLVPNDSEIKSILPGAYFYDAWAVNTAEPDLTALEQFLRVARRTPRWIEWAMALRNHTVRLFGLKHVGGLSQLDANKNAADYQPGDRVGIFTLFAKSDHEVLLGDKDKHLDVVVSIHKQTSSEQSLPVLTLTTVVHVHNWLGRLYMLPVRPAHRIVVRAMLKMVGRKTS